MTVLNLIYIPNVHVDVGPYAGGLVRRFAVVVGPSSWSNVLVELLEAFFQQFLVGEFGPAPCRELGQVTAVRPHTPCRTRSDATPAGR